MPEISNLDSKPEKVMPSAVMLPEGFLKRYNLVVNNLGEGSILREKLYEALKLQDYELACSILKLEGQMEVSWEWDELEQISNVEWRRLQMLPEETQKKVSMALRRGDVLFVKQILKSF